MSGVLDTLTQRRAETGQLRVRARFLMDKAYTKEARNTAQAMLILLDLQARDLDAALASLNKTSEYLEAIASYWESCPGVVMEHAGAALALLAPNHEDAP